MVDLFAGCGGYWLPRKQRDVGGSLYGSASENSGGAVTVAPTFWDYVLVRSSGCCMPRSATSERVGSRKVG